MRQSRLISRRWNTSCRLPFANISRRHFQTTPWLHNRKRPTKNHSNVPFTVREFEQAGPNGERLEFDPYAGLRREERLLKARIEKLEDELQVMRQGPFGPNSEFMLSLPPQEREIALQALKDHDGKSLEDLDNSIDDTELEKLLEEEPALNAGDYNKNVSQDSVPKIQFRLKDKSSAYARGLNKALEKTVEDEDNKANSAELWKWYLRCRMNLPHFTSQIEQDVWDALWSSQLQVPECSRHLKLLAEDILGCGRELQDQQWLIYLDSLRVLGRTGSAIERWREARTKGTSHLQRSPNFWRLGAQLHADSGQPFQAENIAYEAIEEKHGRNFRAFLPVISAWAQDPRDSSPDSRQKAWTCYLTVKDGLGEKMTMEDYEEISTSFLKARKLDLALAVFKDMMLAREDSAYNSSALYKAAVGYVDKLHASSVTESQINSVSIAALTVLPKEFQNKFFYGKWIKKLIGLGEIDAAGAVVELMYERGVRPDTKHLNGILGGWFREEDLHAGEKAERMAWAMVEKRIEYVNLRRQMSYKDAEAALCKTPEGVLIPPFVRRMAPRANMETFSILLLHYVRRGMADAARQLTSHLPSAEIPSNTFILNQVLHLLASKQEDFAVIWKYYCEMKQKISPDLETFALLWDATKSHLDQFMMQKTKNSTGPRGLFHEMQDWLRHFPGQSQRPIRSQFPRDMYEQIVRCFSQGRDFFGTLLALHGMKQLFDCYPDDTTATMIVIQLSRFSLFTRWGKRRGNRRLTTTRAAIAGINKVIDEIDSMRSVKLLEAGIDPVQLAEEPIGPKQLEILTELLMRALGMSFNESHHIRTELDRAAECMGVECPNVMHLIG